MPDFGTMIGSLSAAHIAVGTALALVVALLGRRMGALDGSGAVAAVIVGTAVFGVGGPGLGAMLVGFFVASSALTRWNESAKLSSGAEYAQRPRRDARQVTANGAVATAAAVAYGLSQDPAVFAAFVGALAAVTADTWATEVGLGAAVAPRMITSGQPVQPGTSGAVTALGSAAAAMGGVFIGALAALVVAAQGLAADGVPDLTGVNYLVLAPVAGLVGATMDSVLGATRQAVRRCPRCEKETERERHSCGTPTRMVRGWPWLSGDVVNFVASLAGAAMAVGIALLVFG
jgi:uncharacterized protein (TIGR00297 family)